jgi:hypothetical protein
MTENIASAASHDNLASNQLNFQFLTELVLLFRFFPCLRLADIVSLVRCNIEWMRYLFCETFIRIATCWWKSARDHLNFVTDEYQKFLDELERDPELRFRINLYK